MRLPRYPKYKDSGVPWLGEVPEHWEATRLKILVAEVDKRAGDQDFELLGLSKSQGVVKRSQLEQGASEPDNYAKYKVATVGQLVMNKMQAWNGVFGICPIGGMVSPDYAVFRFLRSGFSNFLSALFRTELMAGVFFGRSRGMGTAFLRLNTPDFLDIKVPLPPLEEAKSIAAFLDIETGKIDALVDEQQRLIELLKEKRQAVISHAVTKGLNPEAPMKSSGVDWLGEVPLGWTVSKLKNFASRITDGAHVSAETENGEYFYISTKDVSDRCLDFSEALLTSARSYAALVAGGCKPYCGDVLFSKDGALVGKTVVVREELDFVVASSLIIITPTAELLLPDYFYYLCQSSLVRGQIEYFVKGAALPRLSIKNLLSFLFVFPSVDEQAQIVDYLEQETAKIERLTAEATRAIDLLYERRTVLISAAVTGKIDVRGIAKEQTA